MQRREFGQASFSAAILGALGARSAWAQPSLPLEQVKFFFGFPAGSSGDIVARRVGDKIAGSAVREPTTAKSETEIPA